ncbi:Ribonuclease P protein component [Prochlorococcus marinus str. SS2]|nr:Ribonuclease P protein component [Prochlorococcus marinus str. SS2]KGG24478.1 Ribonuclease P protein component [Prochlorococcus marinus str. SS35]
MLPKGMRLKGYKSFDYIHKSAKRYKSDSMMLRVTKANERLIKSTIKNSKSNSCRCAISISNKVSKKAVIRNRLRRLLHNHLKKRLFQKDAFSNNWLLLSLSPKCLDKNTENLLEECDKLLIEAGFC